MRIMHSGKVKEYSKSDPLRVLHASPVSPNIPLVHYHTINACDSFSIS